MYRQTKASAFFAGFQRKIAAVQPCKVAGNSKPNTGAGNPIIFSVLEYTCCSCVLVVGILLLIQMAWVRSKKAASSAVTGRLTLDVSDIGAVCCVD